MAVFFSLLPATKAEHTFFKGLDCFKKNRNGLSPSLNSASMESVFVLSQAFDSFPIYTKQCGGIVGRTLSLDSGGGTRAPTRSRESQDMQIHLHTHTLRGQMRLFRP